MNSQDDSAHPDDLGEGPDEPFDERHLPRCRISDEFLQSERPSAPRRRGRPDAWTPERQMTFLRALAACGVVEDAARRAGMTARSAHYLRNRADGGAFAIGWNAAQRLARHRLAAAASSRALHGCVELVMRDGETVGERHRYDNRLLMAVLSRLDRYAESNDDESRAARFAMQEFEEFVEIIGRGGASEAAEFIAARERAENPPALNDAARNLERLDRFRSEGAGLPEPAANAEALWTNLSEAEPQPPADDPVDRTVSLEQAEREAAMRRYFHWNYPPDDGEGHGE